MRTLEQNRTVFVLGETLLSALLGGVCAIFSSGKLSTPLGLSGERGGNDFSANKFVLIVSLIL